MLTMTTVQLNVPVSSLPESFENFPNPIGEAFARMKVGVTFLIFLTVSFGVAIFSFWHVFSRSSRMQKFHWLLVAFIFFALTNISLFKLDCIYGINKDYCSRYEYQCQHSFLDTLGINTNNESPENIFEMTIGDHPNLLKSDPALFGSNFLEILENFNFFTYFVAVVGGSLLFSAACTLTPYRAYAIFCETEEHSEAQIESAIRELNKQLRWLKFYIFAGALLFISALLYLSTSREWPLAFFQDSGAMDSKIFTDIVRSTVLFQAGHFALILLAAFLPITLRLKFAGERLANLMSQNSSNASQNTWMAERGLSLTVGGDIATDGRNRLSFPSAYISLDAR